MSHRARRRLPRDLEDDATNLVDQANEINLPLDRLRKGLTGRLSSGADLQIVHAAYLGKDRRCVMKSRTTRCKVRKASVICALIATTLAPGSGMPVAATAEPPKAELVEDVRVLETFGDDLLQLDKRSGELSKKASLTRAEFESLQNSAEALKRRLSAVQNALRSIIRKLKAAGEWEDLDSRVAETITDGSLRARFRQTSFKRDLEELAENVANKGNEISDPVETFRRKVSAQSRNSAYPSASALAWQAAPATYHPEPAIFTSGGLRCSLSKLRYGVVKLTGVATARAHEAYHCACNIPSGYSCYSPTT